jgi:hypothetical protein
MLPAWLVTLLSGAAGAFVAAWSGAQLGFRRSKKERALDRRIAWHEESIQRLAEYEEALERLRSQALNTLIVEGTRSNPSETGLGPKNIPPIVKADAQLWEDLGGIERRARAALRLADLYAAEMKTRVDCSVALDNRINMVAKQWADLSPTPQIVWTDLSTSAQASASLRRSLQDSLKLVLELDGLLATVLGRGYRQRRDIRRIEKLQRETAANAS